LSNNDYVRIIELFVQRGRGTKLRSHAIEKVEMYIWSGIFFLSIVCPSRYFIV